jgi:hypothetical protein
MNTARKTGQPWSSLVRIALASLFLIVFDLSVVKVHRQNK